MRMSACACRSPAGTGALLACQSACVARQPVCARRSLVGRRSARLSACARRSPVRCAAGIRAASCRHARVAACWHVRLFTAHARVTRLLCVGMCASLVGIHVSLACDHVRVARLNCRYALVARMYACVSTSTGVTLLSVCMCIARMRALCRRRSLVGMRASLACRHTYAGGTLKTKKS